jgi:C-terminal processing protease CtpA/Prc
MKIKSRIVVLAALFLFAWQGFAQNLGDEKARAKYILNLVASEIEKYYYDPTLNGVNLKSFAEQAQGKIDNAQTINQVYTAIFAFVDKLHDSHTFFIPPPKTNFYNHGFEAKAYGDKVFVYRVRPKYGAEAAGLQVGDQIVKVFNYDVERSTWFIMSRFYRRLQPAPRLAMTIIRGDGEPKQIVVEANIKQRKQSLDTANSFDIDFMLRGDPDSYEEELAHSRYTQPDKDGIATIALHTFSYSEDAITSIVGDVNNPKAIILDLRGNFGGYVKSLQALLGKFIPEDQLINTVIKRKKTEEVKVKPQHHPFTGPLVVLVDSESASAAEIFARHVQRVKRGVVLGDQTSGYVNESLRYSEHIGAGSVVYFGISITEGKVVLPGDEILEGKGVTPDQMCLQTHETLVQDIDPCIALAKSVLREKLGVKDEPKTEPGKGNN